MPESRPPRRRRRLLAGRDADPAAAVLKAPTGQTPRWWAPVMVTLMVVGLAWIVTAYVTRLAYPVPGISAWNIAAGFGVALIGFGMTTRWR
ncbi:MAG: cell division protein CrgA [Kineosporiaceae bacterium]